MVGTGHVGNHAAFKVPSRTVALKCICLGLPGCRGGIQMLAVSTLVSTQELLDRADTHIKL